GAGVASWFCRCLQPSCCASGCDTRTESGGTSAVAFDIDERQCTYHPNVRTRLSCSKCGKPICPRCAVETPVGYRCPDCAQVRGLPTYQTNSGAMLKALIVGSVVTVAVGILWGIFPQWN